MKLELIKDDEIWDDFILKSPQGSVYALSKNLNVLGLSACRYGLIDEKNGIVMAVVLPCMGRLNFNRPERVCMYLGIMHRENGFPPHKKIKYEHEVSNEFIKLILENINCDIALDLHPQYKDLRSIQWINYGQIDKPKFNIELKYTAIIPLDGYESFEKYLDSVRSVRRNELRRAKKNHFTVQTSKDLTHFMEMYSKTFERQNISMNVADLEMIEVMIESAINNEYGELTYAKSAEGEVVSGSVFFYDLSCAYYAFGATKTEYRNSGASTLLMFECIENIYRKGIRKIDMVGVNSPNRGDYKTSYNAELAPYHHITFHFND
jgi:hypothetical protein